jgi:hypothetical protein
MPKAARRRHAPTPDVTPYPARPPRASTAASAKKEEKRKRPTAPVDKSISFHERAMRTRGSIPRRSEEAKLTRIGHWEEVDGRAKTEAFWEANTGTFLLPW